jgi:3-hydroxybutyryl-CoA dehydrogenase
MGPLALLDLIGLDTALSIMEVLHAEFGLTRYTPAALLRRLVDAGWTGRKAGRGIYDYAADASDSNGNRLSLDAPDTVTLIGSGDDTETDLATGLASAGVNVTRNAAHPTELVVVAAAAGRPVLPAALAAGRPELSVGVNMPHGLAEGHLVELIHTSLSSDKAMAAATALAEKLGLTAVRAPDRPGFLVGALLYPHLADAVRMVQDGYATATEVDTAMVLGCGYPQGPFQLLDAAGPAIVLAGLRAMQEAYGFPTLAPPILLAEHAAAGIQWATGRGGPSSRAATGG